MRAIGKYIVIRNIDEETKTASGLLLSADDMSKMRYRKGVVVNPGTQVTGINEGDVIHYDKSNSFTMLIQEEQMTIIRESDVVVVVS
jgi:co-chaperonin GroES (HSP10)